MVIPDQSFDFFRLFSVGCTVERTTTKFLAGRAKTLESTLAVAGEGATTNPYCLVLFLPDCPSIPVLCSFHEA